jgi:hypothetical protein
MTATRALWAGFLVTAAASLGCYKTVNTVTIEPLKTDYPVSASGQYVDEIGDILTDEDYVIVKPFTLHRTVESPRHESSVTPLGLKADLDQVVAQWRGDAVIDLKVEATGYESGSHAASSVFQALGWTGVGLGGVILVGGLASHGNRADGATGAGAATIGVGLGLWLLGVAINGPTRWQLDVSGRVVKRASKAEPEVE